MKIVFTTYAKQNLASIFNYLLKNASKEIADNFKQGLFDEIEKLSHYPKLGQLEDDLSDLGKEHRRLVVKHCKIVYRTENDMVYITDIFDSRQNPDKIKG